MKDYKTIIKENTNEFNDVDTLEDFISSYTMQDDVTGLEDDLHEYADGLVPIYYHDIVKEWSENNDSHGLAVEAQGEYSNKGDIYKMMSEDLFYYYFNELSEDYNKLLELLED